MLPEWLERAFLNIFSHTAHHMEKHIPLYHLPAVQAAIERAYGTDVVVERGSLGYFLRQLRTCRLYDYGQHRWMDWNGAYTT